MNRRSFPVSALALACALAVPCLVHAQAYPAKPITVIVPFAPGGGSDNVARMITTKLTERTGKTFIVENRGGGGTNIGNEAAAKAKPDGYTVLLGQFTLPVNPYLYPNLRYSAEKDFAPVVHIANAPTVLIVPATSTVKDVPGVVAMAKAKPGQLNYGSGGSGTSVHLAAELFKQQTKTFITHIPYRGAGPALQDLISGNVDMMFDGLGSSAAHIKGGRIKALMVSGSKRNPAFPELPCAAELGLPEYTVTTWYGLWAPKGTPVEIQARIVDEIKRAVATDELKAVWASNGAEFGNLTPAQFGSFVQAEVKRWAAVVKASGAKLD